MSREQEVLDALSVIQDPDLGKDIVACNFIKELTISDEGHVSFTLELTTPACPVKEQFKSACQTVLKKLPWVESVDVTLSAQKQQSALDSSAGGLKQVKNIIAVSSCKGGVGKSTVAVNLAISLSQAGGKVGLFDADVYGPSLPTILKPDDPEVYQADDMIQPLHSNGLTVMSFGYVSSHSGGGPAIMRGPMVSQVINQLLTGTDWGELDYLVIDMPPGTGDIQLTLTQLIPITAAVIVTTPQELSFVDVVKGIQMFDKLKVPVVASVENMSYFVCDGCSKKHYPFGQGAARKLVEQFGFEHTFELPMDARLSEYTDRAVPYAAQQHEDTIAQTFQEMAGSVVREISRIQHGGMTHPSISYDGDNIVISAQDDKAEKRIQPRTLRRACRCANCIEEFTGRQLLDPDSIDEDIYPTAIKTMGNYAVAIEWSDGHTSSIYPYEAILTLAQEESA